MVTGMTDDLPSPCPSPCPLSVQYQIIVILAFNFYIYIFKYSSVDRGPNLNTNLARSLHTTLLTFDSRISSAFSNLPELAMINARVSALIKSGARDGQWPVKNLIACGHCMSSG